MIFNGYLATDQMKHLYALMAIFIASSMSYSQDDLSCGEPNKKAAKSLESAKKLKIPKEIVEVYRSALDADPENARVNFEFANYFFAAADEYYNQGNMAAGNRAFQSAETLYAKTLELCPDFHADCFFNLGVINFQQNEVEEGKKWVQAFVEFQSDDNSKFPDDYDKKIKDAKSVLNQSEKKVDPGKIDLQSVPFDPTIVRNVSTARDEYFPMISPDNELIFYTRKMDRTSLGDMKTTLVEEFTFSQRKDMFTDFALGEPLAPPFNDGTFSNYGSATVSVDNKEMIICACKKEDVRGQDYLNCDLYSTTYKRSGKGGNDFSWTPLVNLGANINTPDGWEAQPSLSPDGNTLYFTAARPTTKDNDVFVAKRKEDGSWDKAVPFVEINTAGKDKSPFLHQDNETFYFVSSSTEKRKGAGGLDIFYIRKKPDGSWTEPKNIGVPINSPEDEIGLFVSTDGKVAFYSSKVGGNWNIYSFELYEDARPKPVALIKGELKNEKGEAMQDASVEIGYANSSETTKIKVNSDDGKYAAIIKMDEKQDVMVTVKKEGHAFDAKIITKETFEKADPVIRNTDLAVKKLKVGEAYTINDILYATNSAELTDRSRFILRGFAQFLKENPTIKVGIHGHTDDVGEDASNLTLSDDRAKGVRQYLISQGIASNRLTAKGFGETKPKFPNTLDANRAKNRRTEFVIEQL